MEPLGFQQVQADIIGIPDLLLAPADVVIFFVLALDDFPKGCNWVRVPCSTTTRPLLDRFGAAMINLSLAINLHSRFGLLSDLPLRAYSWNIANLNGWISLCTCCVYGPMDSAHWIPLWPTTAQCLPWPALEAPGS